MKKQDDSADQPQPALSQSVPTPAERSDGVPEVPAQDGDETFWEQGTWAGMDKFTCLWKVKRIGGSAESGFYDLPCRQDFWSKDALMAHIRDDH